MPVATIFKQAENTQELPMEKKTKKLALNKNTTKNLKVRTKLQTGVPNATDSEDSRCGITPYCNGSIRK